MAERQPREGPPRWWRIAPLHREMGYVGGTLFASGAAIVAVDLFVPPHEYTSRGTVVVVVLAAFAAGAFYLWSAEHLPLPIWGYAVGTSTGAVMVTVLVVAGGPQRTAMFGVLYALVSTYGFYYYGWRIAWWLVVLNGIGYAGALAWHGVEGAAAQWVTIMGTSVIAGGLTGSLSQRIRRLLAAEQANVVALSEMDAWKTTFLRAVAHDLRSPLASMLGLVELVRDRVVQLDEEQRQHLLDRSVAAGHRLDQLLRDLLDVQRIEAGVLEPELQPVELDQLVRDSVAAIDTSRRSVTLELDPVAAVVEPAKIDRIVTNLVHNALAHTPPEAHVWVRLTEADGLALLVVEDDGPGIADGIRDQLFEAFRRHDGGIAGGVGLGLHLVRRFTELHGGEVRAAERTGGGARFEVRLPRAGAELPRADAE